MEQEKGPGQAIVYARSATCGGQKFPVHWGGDNSATYVSMAETLRGGLSLGLSGFGFWSHDIGGFFGTPTPDLYKRWIAFGLLSSHSRLHSDSDLRVPWNFDDGSADVLRFFKNLKARLKPYLMDMMQEALDHGWPMLRAMVLEFPNDPTCRHLDLQYMLGSALLVAPVFNPHGEVTQGAGWRTEQHSYLSLPVWCHIEHSQRWDCLNGYLP
ncbi:MAG: hypothetical protein GYB65_20790 [Chloroflexi bacterium]|nr:hypothetical protein [Chloroflexota bacterium]